MSKFTESLNRDFDRQVVQLGPSLLNARMGTAEHAAGGLDLFDDGDMPKFSFTPAHAGGQGGLATPSRRPNIFHVPVAAAKSDDETSNNSMGIMDVIPSPPN